MKNTILITTIIVLLLGLTSCVDVNLNPLSEASSENWNSTQEEIEMSLNEMYSTKSIPVYGAIHPSICGPLLGIDIVRRQETYYTYNGVLNADNANWYNENRWPNLYASISRCLRIISDLKEARSAGMPESLVFQYEGEAWFFIGLAYGDLAFHYGDVILYKTRMALEEAYTMTRSPKSEVLEFAYDCFDRAAELLPESYSGLQKMTKGAALAYKARYALYNGDFEIAAKAAKDCMDLGIYILHDNYQELFTTAMSPENIWFFRGDVALRCHYWLATGANYMIYNTLPRVHGGWGVYGPTYELFCAYTCTDGLPIDESPLYDYRDPFANRDPRMSMTIIPFATAYTASVLNGTYNPADYAFLGIENSPNPRKTHVVRIADGSLVSNTDSKARAEHSTYNGLMLKKFVDETWMQNGYSGAATNYIDMRYGDVLLMYAEAMNELGRCTQEVLDNSINLLRERAYRNSGLIYPKVLAGSQEKLRTVIRTERFVELAAEGHNYNDLIRWRIAEDVLNRPIYYLTRAWSGSASWDGDMSAVANEDFKALCERWDAGRFPFGGIPEIDANGIADLSPMADAGDIVQATMRSFNKERDYLWPIPSGDLLINKNITQNPYY